VSKVFIVGAGAWGTALGVVAQQAGSKVILWGRSLDHVTSINTEHRIKHLPDVTLSASITATNDIAEIENHDIIILAVPSQSLRDVLKMIKPHATKKMIFVVACKGIEMKTGLLMTEVIEEVVPGMTVAVLSGPNFAPEIAKTLPTATTLACADNAARDKVVQALNYTNFRLYLNNDIIGAQVGGALKNVLAIGCGIAQGYGLGENSMASLITRGLVEIAELGVKKGGIQETFYGLSGLGDIILTCMGSQSRNYKLGRAIGRGAKIEDILESTKDTVEGFHTADSVRTLAKKLGVDMPICETIFKSLYEDLNVPNAISFLLDRPVREEIIL
jgi:glycerol-3-phosphate dehydrogenase (NAD(P)+)